MKVARFALALVVLAWTSVAQAQSPDVQQKPFTFGMTVEMVHLGVTVMKKGRIVTDLVQKEFEVYEDGALQQIEYFSKGTDAPVDLFLLVDASGSMDMVQKVASAKNTAIQLIYSLDPEDRVAVYAFDRELMKLQDFTEDKEAAIRSLEEIEPFGITAIYDAVARASTVVAEAGFGRRAIVLITDGVDTGSELSPTEAVEFAKRVDLPLYVVRVLSPIDDPSHDQFVGARETPGHDALALFAEETGGQLYTGSEIGVLRQISIRIREELKTQYRLSYVPRNTAQDGRFRRVDVRTSKKGLEARTRKGYYARPPGRGAPFAKATGARDRGSRSYETVSSNQN